jgi:FkbM family methyltransferase
MSRRIHRFLNAILPFSLRDRLRDGARPFIPSLRHFDMEMRLRTLAELGFRPPVIFDVGAAGGNWATLAHSIWPGSRIVGFEPNRREQAALDATRARIPAFEYHLCFLGRERKTVEYVDNDRQTSILDDHAQGARARAQMQVLDELIAAGTIPAPDFIKLDVQGFELEVLAGAEKAMQHARGLLLEVSFVPFHPGMPTIDVVLDFLRERGFVWHDVAGILRRPTDDCLWQMDAFFLRHDDPLRLSALKGWDAR